MVQFDMLGQEIVDELSKLIKEHVLVTDRRGFIQASNDTERINQFHEGALYSIRHKKQLCITEKEVEVFQGVRKGIVMPIIIQEEPIAALGITGEPEQIKPQAQLILRVAELFIQESTKQKQKEEQVRDVEFFVFDWLTATKKDERFLERGALLGIDVQRYCQVAMIEIVTKDEQLSIQELETFASIQNIHEDVQLIRWGQNKILLLLPELNQEILKQELELLMLHVKRMKKVRVAAGVGGMAHHFDLATSFMQAERAVQASGKTGTLLFEQDLRFEIILQSIPEAARKEFLERTVAPLLEEEELLHNVAVWFSENQSMQNTAQRLHIHKNTLSYRLQKVKQLTGLSVSETHDVFQLYLGLYLLGELPVSGK